MVQVEARYRRYCDHLQLVITRFNSRAGPGAATPYTILALHAMSRHFRYKDIGGGQIYRFADHNVIQGMYVWKRCFCMCLGYIEQTSD